MTCVQWSAARGIQSANRANRATAKPLRITRIGGGEVRINNALKSPVAAWDRNSLTGSLSFGFQDVTGQTGLLRRVTIQNYSNRAIILRSEVEYRYDEDAGGEVRLSAPSWLQVPACGSVTTGFVRQTNTNWVRNTGMSAACIETGALEGGKRIESRSVYLAEQAVQRFSFSSSS